MQAKNRGSQTQMTTNRDSQTKTTQKPTRRKNKRHTYKWIKTKEVKWHHQEKERVVGSGESRRWHFLTRERSLAFEKVMFGFCWGDPKSLAHEMTYAGNHISCCVTQTTKGLYAKEMNIMPPAWQAAPCAANFPQQPAKHGLDFQVHCRIIGNDQEHNRLPLVVLEIALWVMFWAWCLLKYSLAQLF